MEMKLIFDLLLGDGVYNLNNIYDPNYLCQIYETPKMYVKLTEKLRKQGNNITQTRQQ